MEESDSNIYPGAIPQQGECACVYILYNIVALVYLLVWHAGTKPA